MLQYTIVLEAGIPTERVGGMRSCQSPLSPDEVAGGGLPLAQFSHPSECTVWETACPVLSSQSFTQLPEAPLISH
jgi:hypothetical protein